jgi:hypothetical protein
VVLDPYAEEDSTGRYRDWLRGLRVQLVQVGDGDARDVAGLDQGRQHVHAQDRGWCVRRPAWL